MIERILCKELRKYPEFRLLAEEFFIESKMQGELDFDAFLNKIENYVGEISVWILLDEGRKLLGTIGGILTSHAFTNKLIAVEMFWFVRAEHRGGMGGIRLLNEFEEWARVMRATAIHIAYMEGIHPDKMAIFYSHRKYKVLETMYVRQIWQ